MQFHCKLEGLILPEGFSEVTAEGSSEECWICMHLRFPKTVQLHLRIFQASFRPCVAAFRSSGAALVMEVWTGDVKVSES